MRAIQATRAGGPEVLAVVDLSEPVPGPGQLLVEVAAAGVNFIDTYRRSGLYPMPFPHVVGSEGAGVVLAVGPAARGGAGDGVERRVAVGERVAWLAGAPGSYAQRVLVDAAQAVPVPEAIGLDVAAALMLQGATAHYLVDATFPVLPGHDVLVHAGAGGVGLLATQLAVARGARVLTTVSSAHKEALSRGAGAAHVLRYDLLDDLPRELPAWVRGLTGGDGVHTVFDGVGRATFDASLASLRPRGGLALFGGSSGPVPPFDPQRLAAGGSLFLTRPTLGHYVATRAELLGRTDALFAAVDAGTLDVRIGARFGLDQAAEAHRALEGRATTGKVLLLP